MAFDANYQSYLLRLWRDGTDQPWRASLQCTATADKFAFADLPALSAFLLEEFAINADEREQASAGHLSATEDTLSTISTVENPLRL